MSSTNWDRLVVSAEARIDKFAERLPGLPKSFNEIVNFPFPNFESFNNAASIGLISITKFVFDYNTYIMEMFGTKTNRFFYTVFLGAAYLIPVTALITCFFVNWWFLLGLLAFPFFLTRNKKLYLRVLFRAPFLSEKICSFLFFTKDIGILDKNDGQVFYFKDGTTVK